MNSVSAMESKPADVFAFAMLSVEVFTGKIPFEKQENEAVVLLILQGHRPELPEEARTVGFTGKMRKVLENCWQQDPGKRPSIEEVVKGWGKFVGPNNGNNVATECV